MSCLLRLSRGRNLLNPSLTFWNVHGYFSQYSKMRHCIKPLEFAWLSGCKHLTSGRGGVLKKCTHLTCVIKMYSTYCNSRSCPALMSHCEENLFHFKYDGTPTLPKQLSMRILRPSVGRFCERVDRMSRFC